MDFSTIKSITIPQGNVKQISIGGNVVWKKKTLPPLLLWLDGINNTRSGHNASSTRWEDLSGNNNDFTRYANTITWDDNSFVGNGTNSATMSRNKAILQNKTKFTVEICVNQKTLSGGGYSAYSWIFQSRQTSPANGFQFIGTVASAPHGLSFTLYAPAGTSNNFKIQPFDTLHTLAFSYDGETVKGYGDGELKASFAKSMEDMKSVTDRNIYAIGSQYPWQSTNLSVFKGNLYSIKIYDGALTAEQLAENHTNNVARFNT